MAYDFGMVGAPEPSHSTFDLSHMTTFDAQEGLLYPVCTLDCVPGDVFDISEEVVIRAYNPPITSILQNIRAKIWYFFVPYRILDDNFEEFITGGIDGKATPTLERWTPTNAGLYSLWDYFGFPVGIIPTGAYAPLAFPRTAYNDIWNEYFKDESIDEDVDLANESVLRVRWTKDYFTSALLSPQRGNALALPISGTLPANVDITKISSNPYLLKQDTIPYMIPVALRNGMDSLDTSSLNLNGIIHTAEQGPSAGPLNLSAVVSGAGNALGVPLGAFGNNLLYVNLSDAATFDANDMRYVFAAQRFMELSNRAGNRYIEFLQAHFAVSPTDARLQRPEFIGMCSAPIIVSEVLQNSESVEGNPLGKIGGHAISATTGDIGSYRCEEFGIIIGLMTIVPDAMYHQGIPRNWLKQTRYDWCLPEFVNTGEQEILQEEIFAENGTGNNGSFFGYQGRFDEYRYMSSNVKGAVRPGQNLDFWTQCRHFDSAPALNSTFLECNPDRRVFSVTDETQTDWIVSVGHNIRAVRPLPMVAVPGLIDHA